MKKQRHDAIIRIITTENIATQGDLLERLIAEGFDTTQATISRDIKDLRLIKKPDESGKSCYSVDTTDTAELSGKYKSVFDHCVISSDYAGNMVAIKCYNGMANAACAAFDAMGLDDIVGTLAGDDTIFILCRSENAAADLKQKIDTLKN